MISLFTRRFLMLLVASSSEGGTLDGCALTELAKIASAAKNIPIYVGNFIDCDVISNFCACVHYIESFFYSVTRFVVYGNCYRVGSADQ